MIPQVLVLLSIVLGATLLSIYLKTHREHFAAGRAVFQGHQLPLTNESPPDQRESLFPFKDSDCTPECCLSNPTHSCDRGCICGTARADIKA